MSKGFKAAVALLVVGILVFGVITINRLVIQPEAQQQQTEARIERQTVQEQVVEENIVQSDLEKARQMVTEVQQVLASSDLRFEAFSCYLEFDFTPIDKSDWTGDNILQFRTLFK
jgi:cytochrome c-type biogenesis protein CcmH/NrfF